MDIKQIIQENFIQIIQNKYADFSGRAGRKEYWMFFLVNLVISCVLGAVLGVIHLGALSFLYSLAVLCPGIAVGVRRLHDTDRSGWWALLALIPFIGPLGLIVLLALEGTAGDNKFGPRPKAITTTGGGV
jgi:uncharacterized membrane protein YhaH (DUF805 family)